MYFTVKNHCRMGFTCMDNIPTRLQGVQTCSISYYSVHMRKCMCMCIELLCCPRHLCNNDKSVDQDSGYIQYITTFKHWNAASNTQPISSPDLSLTMIFLLGNNNRGLVNRCTTWRARSKKSILHSRVRQNIGRKMELPTLWSFKKFI